MKTNHPHIAAWGKFLNFKPESVEQYLAEAAADNAPYDAIQKIDGRWLTLDDIQNAKNRQTVEDIAAREFGAARA